MGTANAMDDDWCVTRRGESLTHQSSLNQLWSGTRAGGRIFCREKAQKTQKGRLEDSRTSVGRRPIHRLWIFCAFCAFSRPTSSEAVTRAGCTVIREGGPGFFGDSCVKSVACNKSLRVTLRNVASAKGTPTVDRRPNRRGSSLPSAYCFISATGKFALGVAVCRAVAMVLQEFNK